MKRFLLTPLFFLLFLSMRGPIIAQTTTVFQVNNVNDSGPGSFRQAILDYNASFNFGARIQFNLGMFPGTIYLQSPLPAVGGRFPGDPFTGNFGAMQITIAAANTVTANSNGVYYSNYTSGNIITIKQFGSSGSFNYIYFKPKAFVVTTTQATGPGSLKDMIIQSEGRAVTDYDSIVFNITGPAPHVIQPTERYIIESRVVIDATTQPANGYTGSGPKIELEGSKLAYGSALFFGGYGNEHLSSAGSEVYGFYIHHFKMGISYSIGSLTFGKPGKGNVLSGNTSAIGNLSDPYNATSYASNITIQNNTIGLDPSGAVEANVYGINFIGDNIYILNNTISGNTAAAINRVNYMSQQAGLKNIYIRGNKIGVSEDGHTKIGNGNGITLSNSSNIYIGGPGAQRNIISGNAESAIALGSVYWPVTGISITNNYIGTDITGTKDFGNKTGILLSSDSIATVIGGSSVAQGNLIAYNKTGIYAGQSGSLIQSNSFLKNEVPIASPVLHPPVITTRSSALIEGTAFSNTLIQLYEDDESQIAQGKTFIGEATANASGQWTYEGIINNPCRITAICLKPDQYWSSGFSLASLPDLIPDTLIYCHGTASAAKAVDGFPSYTWSNGFVGQTLMTTNPGQYVVRVNNGCEYKDTVTILFIDRPVVALGNDTSFCNSQPYVLNAGSTPQATYKWSYNGMVSPASTQSTYTLNTNSSTGKYAVEVSVGMCKNSDTILTTIYITPHIATKATVEKCINETYTLTKPATANAYLWSTGATTNSIAVLQPGVYTVVATSPEGCSSERSRDTIKVNDVLIQANLGQDTTVCGLTNTVVKDLSASGATNYNWYRKPAGGSYSYVALTSSFTITQNGSYAVRAWKGSCIKFDTIDVAFYTVPKAVLGNDTIVCGPINLQSRQNSAGALYTWSTGTTGNILPVTSSGTFSLEIKYADHCLSRDTIQVSVVNCNAFKGMVYLDKNNNKNYEASDSLLMHQLLQAKSQTGVTYYTQTKADGSYLFELPSGIYTVTTAFLNGQVTVPQLTYYTINAGQSQTQTSFDFAVDLPSNELSVQMTTPATVRLGNYFLTTLSIQNLGTTSQSALVTLQKDGFMNLVETTANVSSTSATHVSLDAGMLLPGQSSTITLQWMFPIHATLSGITVSLSAALQADEVLNNNYAVNTIRAGYPFDPNHKYVGVQYDAQAPITAGHKKLQYVIEFQNTGTDTAYQVVIKDTLHKKLNPLTFQAGMASAPYTWEIAEGGILIFTFATIHLPDSNVNQEGSKGFVSFSIDHSLSEIGDSVYNEAAILFDLAEPVITNKVVYKVPGLSNQQSIFLNTLPVLKYGQGYVMITAGSTSGLPVSYAYDGPVKMRGDTLFIMGSGRVRLEVFQSGNHEFLSAPSQYVSFEIGKASQSIIFEAIADKFLTEENFKLEASGGNSGNPIVFQVISGPVNIDGDVVTLTGTGEVEIMATQEGNSLYEEAASVSRTFRISFITATVEQHSTTVSVAPNPFSESLELNVDASYTEDITYTIYDLQGQRVYAAEWRGEKIQTEQLPKGYYLLKVFTREQTLLLQKILKQ